MDYGFFIAYQRCFLNSGLLFSRNRWTLISLQLWTFISQQPSTFIFLNLWPGPSILKTCGLYFQQLRSLFGPWMFLSLAASVFLTVDFYYLIIGGILLCQNRWTFIMSNWWFFLSQKRWTFIIPKSVDFYSLKPKHSFLKTCGLLFSTAAEFIWTMDFYIAYRRWFLNSGLLFSQNRGTFIT